jgi:ABC-2 type transport system permease protein
VRTNVQWVPTRRALLIAKRDYLVSVKSKAFLFGLILFPILFGGGMIGIAVMKAKPDLADRHVVLLDRTGKLAQYMVAAAERKNKTDSIDLKTGIQTEAHYIIDPTPVEPGDQNEQRLALCDRVRKHEIFGFLDVAADAIHPLEPTDDKKEARADGGLYSDAGKLDQAEGWLGAVLSEAVRTARLAELGIDPKKAPDAMKGAHIDTMTLVVRDAGTGTIQTPVKQNVTAAFFVPFGTMMLLFMVIMIGAAPMMTSATEDKSNRIVEMLLGIATPMDLMAGKVLAGVARSLTSSVLYVTGATFVLLSMNIAGVAPLAIVPWFYAFLIAQVTMMCAMATSLGAACNTPQEAGNLVMLILAPVMIPLFLMAPIASNPNGAFATVMSLLPPFSPSLMIFRMSMPSSVPAWQPWAGLAGTIIFAMLGIWIASRIFRVAILMQGQPLRMKLLVEWAMKG